MHTTKTLLVRISALLGVIALITAATTLSNRARSESASQPTPAPPLSPANQDSGSPVHPQLVRVFVHGNDLYPDVAVVRPGKVLLVAENETQSDISLVVEKRSPGQSPQRIGRLVTRRRDRRTRQELTLGAGEYVFYPESHPILTGRLIVDPNPR